MNWSNVKPLVQYFCGTVTTKMEYLIIAGGGGGGGGGGGERWLIYLLVSPQVKRYGRLCQLPISNQISHILASLRQITERAVSVVVLVRILMLSVAEKATCKIIL